jgi:hypothetical protein
LPRRSLSGLLCFALSAVLLVRDTPMIARVVAYAASPLVLFLALYGALGELVVLYTEHADLRLWIVDH